MKFRLTTAQLSAIKTGGRAFLALVVYVILTGFKVPVEFAGVLSVATPVILHAIDPTFKEYGLGKTPIQAPSGPVETSNPQVDPITPEVAPTPAV